MSLFLRIYLSFLGGVAVLALAGAAAAVLAFHGGRDDDRGLLSRREEIAAAILPPSGDPAEIQALLRRLGAATGAEWSLTDARGDLIAASGPQEDRRRKPFLTALPDGSVLAVRLDGGVFGGGAPPGGPLAVLLLAAGGIALIARPLARRLTRRLERLRSGVEAWGAGDLSRRVPAEGQDEIAAVAASFNRAAAQVEALMASRRALLANASHELRSPLARLRMGMDLYEADPSPARRAEILRNLAELDDLVEEILLSSRLEHGAAEPFQPLDLLALVAEEAAREGLKAEGESVEVMGDARLLIRLTRNLILNAERHGAPPVAISVRRRGSFAELAVRDHGAGVPAGEGEKVFDPFHRPGGHGEAAGGWGLGLALVRQIAERHGGSVRHETPPGGGARFLVALPLAFAAG